MAQGSESSSAPALSQLGLAPHDLRDPLVAHAHDLSDGVHRQTIGVGGADRFVPFLLKCFTGLVKGCLALGVALGKGSQLSLGLGCLAFSSGDASIV